MTKINTVEQASQEAIKWCVEHPEWRRICDIEDSDALYEKFEDISIEERRYWNGRYGYLARNAWEEFGNKKCKVPYGFITGEGKFFADVHSMPHGQNFMMVFKTS